MTETLPIFDASVKDMNKRDGNKIKTILFCFSLPLHYLCNEV